MVPTLSLPSRTLRAAEGGGLPPSLTFGRRIDSAEGMIGTKE